MDQEQFFKMQTSGLFVFFDRLIHLSYVNVLMILFSILGLFVFGFYPAVFAAAGIFNETFEAKGGNTFRRFFTYYKKYFLIGNLCMAYTTAVMGAGYYLLFVLPEDSTGVLFSVLFFLLFCFLFVGMIWNMYLPYINTMYPSFPLKKKLLFSLAAGFTKWKLTFCLLFLFCAGIAAILMFPSFMLFLAVSVIPFASTYFIKKALLPETVKNGNEKETNE